MIDLSFDYIGSICDENMLSLRNFIESQSEKIVSLTININSQGGSVPSGIALYNYLKQKNFTVITHNLSEVSSAAILLYLAGDIRTASDVSKFIIHPITYNITNDLIYPQIKELYESISLDISNYEKIVNENTNSLNGLFNTHQCLCSDGVILDYSQAYQCGLITPKS